MDLAPSAVGGNMNLTGINIEKLIDEYEERIAELAKQNEALKRRCVALTQGQLCEHCAIDCIYRKEQQESGE